MGLDELEKRLAKDPFVGKQLGNISVERWMADGSTGRVYFGVHSLSKKEIAVRVLFPEMTKAAGAKDKMLFEVRIAQQINHANVVPVVEAGEVDGRVYVAMEFVKGEPLEALIKRQGRVEFERATRIVRDIALGLEAAHDLNLVHRDLRPANVLLDTDGHPRINNFGLARPVSVGSGRTQVGAFLGVPDYLAPEQVDGKVVDSVADQYALGVIYFRMLTGLLPFDGENDAAIARARLKDDLPVVESIPERGRALLHKLCARDPKQRFATAREVAGQCERALYARETATPGGRDGKPKEREPAPVPVAIKRKAAAPYKPERHGLTHAPDAKWVQPLKTAIPYAAFVAAAGCVAAAAGMRTVPSSVRFAFLASAFFPMALAAGMLLKQRAGWQGVVALLLGAGSLGILFYGLSVPESWQAVAVPFNALALGVSLVVGVAVTVLGDVPKAAVRRVLLLVAFVLVAYGAGAFRGAMPWMQSSPARTMPMLAATTLAGFCAVFLMPAARSSMLVRFAGFVTAALAVAGLAYGASAGQWQVLVADMAGRFDTHGTAAVVVVPICAVAHALLKSRI